MKKLLAVVAVLVSIASADQVIELEVSGMTCPVCAKHVKKALSKTGGVKESIVYLKDGRAEVKAADGVKVEALCASVKKAGYGCRGVN